MTPSNPSPQIVHLVPVDGLGGVETAARSAAESDTLGCNLTLYFLAGPTLATNRSRVVDHPQRRLNRPSTFLAAVRDLAALRPDVLVCSLWRSMLVGMAVKRLRPSTKLVIFLHFPRGIHLVDRMTQRLAFRVADELWADSGATLDAIGKTTGTPIRQISFVVHNRARLPETRAAPRFISWARLHPQKGHDYSLSLIKRLATLGLDAQLEIWGADCGSGEALRQQSERLGLSSRVTFAGEAEHSRLAEIARGCAFYLGLSRQEGFGMSVVEAMQLGLIPIVTPVGEVARYVRDGENGLLVDTEELSAAAERIAELLRSPQTIERLSMAASATWAEAPLFRDDLCAAALALVRKPTGA